MRIAAVLVGLTMATGAVAHEPSPEPFDDDSWLPGQVPSALGLGIGLAGIGIAAGGTGLVFAGAARGEDGANEVHSGIIAIAAGHAAVTTGAILLAAGTTMTLDLLASRGADVDPLAPRVAMGFALAGGVVGLAAPVAAVFLGTAESYGFAAGLGVAGACLVISYALGTHAYAQGNTEQRISFALAPYITPSHRGLLVTVRF